MSPSSPPPQARQRSRCECALLSPPVCFSSAIASLLLRRRRSLCSRLRSGESTSTRIFFTTRISRSAMVSLASLQVTPLFLCRSWGDAVLRILLSNLVCVDLEKSHGREVGLGHFFFCEDAFIDVQGIPHWYMMLVWLLVLFTC